MGDLGIALLLPSEEHARGVCKGFVSKLNETKKLWGLQKSLLLKVKHPLGKKIQERVTQAGRRDAAGRLDGLRNAETTVKKRATAVISQAAAVSS